MTLANITDEIDPDIRVNDRFSLRRVGEIYAYYGPTITRQCAIYLVISLLCSVLILLPVNEMLQFGIFSAVWALLPFMSLLAPCAFGLHGASQIIERLIPAKASEKMTFFLTYTLIVIPIAVYAMPFAARLLYLNIPSIQTPGVIELYDIQMSSPSPIIFMNLLTNISAVLACLLTVEISRSSRVLKGIAAVLVVNFITAICGAVYGLTSAFSAGFQDGINGKDCTSANQQEFLHRILDEMSHTSAYLITIDAIFIAFIIIMLWLMHHTLKRRNL